MGFGFLQQCGSLGGTGRAARRGLAMLTVALSLPLLAASCAEQYPDRDFVQPDVLSKTLFSGDWYYRQVVTDIAYKGATSSFIGYQGDVTIIRWEVQEKTLLAKRAYDLIDGAEFQYKNDFDKGAVIAAFPITSHFDIQRQYNPATGEEQNVIVENSTDRPWYERSYFRVDWGKNDAYNSGLFDLETADIQPVEYRVNNPLDKDRPQITKDYMDITTKIVLTPRTQEADIGNGTEEKVPYCLFYVGVNWDCYATEIKLRNSFMKRNPDNDYVPEAYSEKDQEKFGFFKTERLGYDSNYQEVESLRKRYANIHNIWKKSKSTDGTVIPKHERETKSIVYYLNEDHPADLANEAGKIALMYDKAYKDAVNGLRLAYGTAKQNGEGQFKVKKVYDIQETEAKLNDPTFDYFKFINELPQDEKNELMFVLCQNPVPEGAPAQCGKAGTNPQIGDLRYSFMYQSNDPRPGSPWGYGPSSVDPLTGEILSSNAYIYNWVTDFIVSRSTDTIMFQLGRIKTQDYVTGNDIREQLGAPRLPPAIDNTVVRDPVRGSTNTAFANVTPETFYTKEQIQAMASNDFAKRMLVPGGPKVQFGSGQSVVKQMDARRQYLEQAGFLDQKLTGEDSKLQQFVNSPLAEKIVTRDNLLATGVVEGAKTISDAVGYAKTLPLRLKQDRERSEAINRTLMQKTIDMAEFLTGGFNDASIQGLVTEFDRKYGGLSNDEFRKNVRADLRRRLYLSVEAHEVGHTVGFRHMFVASFDALNYFPKYWELRLGNGSASTGGNAGPRGPDLRNPATATVSIDPITQTELNEGMTLYQYSSIMEYGSGFEATNMGLGPYDYAAIKYAYTSTAEVYADLKPENVQTAIELNAIRSFNYPILVTSQGNLHYTDYPRIYGDGTKISSKKDVPRAWLADRYVSFVGQQFEDFVYCGKPKDDSKTKLCSTGGGACVDVDGNRIVDDQGAAVNDCTEQEQVVASYLYCSDEFNGARPNCRVYDQGADFYEQASYASQAYRNYYFSNNFKRDRLLFFFNSITRDADYMNRIRSRYFELFRDHFTWLNLYGLIFLREDDPATVAEFNDPLGFGNLKAATHIGFDTLMQAVMWPEPGRYSYTVKPSGSKVYALNSEDLFADDPNAIGTGGGSPYNVFLGDGRYFETQWDNEAGYFWIDQIKYIGNSYDKQLALDVLTEGQTYFVGRDQSVDIRRYNMPYWSLYAPEMRKFFTAAMTEEYEGFSPMVIGTNGSDRKMVFPRFSVAGSGQELAAVPAGSTALALNPKFDFTLQMWAATLATTRFSGYFPQFVGDGASVPFDTLTYLAVKGEGRAPDYKGPTVEFEDPFSGFTYIAADLRDAEGDQIGIAARMLDHANTLRTIYLDTTKSDTIRNRAGRDLSQFIDKLAFLSGMREIVLQ
jgi:hypothetical protein